MDLNPDYHSLPPVPVLLSVIDTFFLHVKNESYACLTEGPFRRNFETGKLPRYLLLAVLALSVSHSNEPYYRHNSQEATDAYAADSWSLLASEHLPDGASEHATIENPRIEIVQTINLLGMLDWAAGRLKAVGLKFTIAARACRDLRLMVEPRSSLSFSEQEERRRIFWACYTLNRIGSFDLSLDLLDEECTLQLPCDDEAFRAGEWQSMVTLDELNHWDFEANECLNLHSVIMFLISIIGRCVKQLLWAKHRNQFPPWDANSEFSKISLLLHRVQYYFRKNTESFVKEVCDGISANRQHQSYAIYARATFHTCHCLLNHPFIVQYQLRPFRPSVEFRTNLLDNANHHARQLLFILSKASQLRGLYPQEKIATWPNLIAIAASVLSPISHMKPFNDQCKASETSEWFERSLRVLQHLPGNLPHVAPMAARLRKFHEHAHTFSTLLDSTCPQQDIDPATEQALWAILDHDIKNQQAPERPQRLSTPDSVSCASLDLGSNSSSPSSVRSKA